MPAPGARRQACRGPRRGASPGPCSAGRTGTAARRPLPLMRRAGRLHQCAASAPSPRTHTPPSRTLAYSTRAQLRTALTSSFAPRSGPSPAAGALAQRAPPDDVAHSLLDRAHALVRRHSCARKRLRALTSHSSACWPHVARSCLSVREARGLRPSAARTHTHTHTPSPLLHPPLRARAGVGQMGRAFRNEISPGQFLFRTREFEQLELQYFTLPEEAAAQCVALRGI